jgi:hypothetical protein
MRAGNFGPFLTRSEELCPAPMPATTTGIWLNIIGNCDVIVAVGRLILTMKTFTLMLAAGLMLAGYMAKADDAAAGKDITITGSMVCGKCTLHETKSCQNVVQVKQDGKNVNYYLKQNDVSKAAHDPVCGGGAEQVTVTGTVVEKDGKELLTPKKIEPVKT